MTRLLLILSMCVLVPVAARAGAIAPPVSERFAKGNGEEVPDFQQHVLPLMGRLGCNGRACHGSFQGQGGFRLSLFGYDFKTDHEAMTKGDEPRVNAKDPLASLILEKPTSSEDEHGGGKRMEKGSWQFNVFHRWVAAGAPTVKEDRHFEQLEVTPAEFVFKGAGDQARLRVIAHWSDGTAEEVTCICRFQTNNESVAEIDADGRVTAKGKGDTHVVAFYDNGVAALPVMIPVSDRVGANYPSVPTPTTVDELVVQKLRKLGIVPSDPAADEEFLRRVTLDATGTLPTPKEIEAYLADKSADKRDRKIDELLKSPAYAAWWATRLCDVMGNNERNLQNNNNGIPRGFMTRAWYEWVRERLEENLPYDQIIERVAVASSRLPGQSYDDYCKEMSAYAAKNDPHEYVDRQFMPLFWEQRTFRGPEGVQNMALGFAYTFLGVRLQCASCHKHPFDQWTQQDFQQFTAFFNGVGYGLADNEARQRFQQMNEALGLNERRGNAQDRQRAVAEAIRQGKVIPFQEMFASSRDGAGVGRGGQRRQPTGRVITPKLLGGEEVLASQYKDPRQALMDWMRDKDNPYFARAIVNRIWAAYFGVGIIDPPDDQNLANPPANRELLDYLARGFIDSGFDLRWIHRQIARSRTYQLSWRTNETNQFDERNFSHALVRRLPAEVAYDAIGQATAAQVKSANDDPDGRAISAIPAGYQGQARGGGPSYALRLFGKPDRETTCDCERSNEPSLLQSIFLQNDQEMLTMIQRPGSWITQVAHDRSESLQPAAYSPEGGGRREAVNGEAQRRIADVERRIAELRKAGKKGEANELQARLASFTRRDDSSKKGQRPDARAQQAAATPPQSSEALIREAYLRTLGRLPAPDEVARCKGYLQEADGTAAGLKDVLWALLNTKEFITNH